MTALYVDTGERVSVIDPSLDVMFVTTDVPASIIAVVAEMVGPEMTPAVEVIFPEAVSDVNVLGAVAVTLRNVAFPDPSTDHNDTHVMGLVPATAEYIWNAPVAACLTA
jgi:hypothetical protein